MIFNDESVAAEGPFSNYSALRFAIWAMSSRLVASHGGVALHDEVSDLLERPWATLNTILCANTLSRSGPSFSGSSQEIRRSTACALSGAFRAFQSMWA